MIELRERPIDPVTMPYVFLLLQGASFGAKAVCIRKDGTWSRGGLKKPFIRQKTDAGRVNPMQLKKETLLERLEEICKRMKGVTGLYGDVMEMNIHNRCPSATTYIDPPYRGTTGYGVLNNLDLDKLIQSLKQDERRPIWVSESHELPGCSSSWLLSESNKGRMFGKVRTGFQEWLSLFAA